jgi:valyl-tRNA synthetase
VGRAIPVIADDYVDKDFGTGVVKVTPRTTPTTTPWASATGCR